MASIIGNNGNNTISGTDDDDRIDGRNGRDTIFAGAGNDEIIDTDRSQDVVFGGAGDDIWRPLNQSRASGSDQVFLEDGDDTAFLGFLTVGQNETIDGGAGVDTYNFSNFPNFAGDVTILGNGTLDFEGTLVSENVYLNFENVIGSNQRNTLTGNDQNNLLDGGGQDDTLFGGGGDDSLIGGQGRDSIDGGTGNDTIDGGADGDRLDGGAGQDTVFGGQGQDTVSGGAGDDQAFGGQGDDRIFGDDGNDSLFGGQGQDSLFGGDGDDTLRGADGPGQDNDDRLFGGAGNDTLIAEDVQDSLFGGTGDDFLTIQKDGNLGTLTADGGTDPDEGDIDVLDLKTGIENGDWEGVRIFATNGQRIFDSQNPIPGQDINTIPENGRAELLQGNNVVGRVTFREIERIAICFTPGTMIATPRGEIAVETLQPGDKIFTRDNGIQDIVWSGARTLSGAELAQTPKFAPVFIRAGALGPNTPEDDLLVSPNHRMLIVGHIAALYFEENEVLVAAKHLTHLDGIDQVGASGVTYIHMMCAQHEVVLANGAWSETFQPGDYAVNGLAEAQRSEILQLFPELSDEAAQPYAAARKTLKKHEALLLN